MTGYSEKMIYSSMLLFQRPKTIVDAERRSESVIFIIRCFFGFFFEIMVDWKLRTIYLRTFEALEYFCDLFDVCLHLWEKKKVHFNIFLFLTAFKSWPNFTSSNSHQHPHKLISDRCLLFFESRKTAWNDFYKINKILRARWLVECHLP